jgi:O-antigen/teichoic acid export membrane protein
MRTLTNTATQASNIIMNPITPDLVKYYYRGESKKLSAVLSVSWMLNGVLVGPAIVIGLWLVAPFYRVWTRDAVSFEPLLFATLALAVCVRNWAAPLYTLLAGTNSLAPQVVIALIRALVTLGFSGLLLPAFGSSGAGCGVLAGEVLAAGYAALRIQNDVIATAGTGSQFSSALMSIISTCVVAVALGIFSYKGNVESVTSCVILATLSVIAAMQWRTLPQEVRDRILRLGLQMIRVK